jgi:hypothetical protein
MYNVLTKKEDQRKKDELSTLVTVVKEIPFFKDRNMSESSLIDVVNCMTI